MILNIFTLKTLPNFSDLFDLILYFTMNVSNFILNAMRLFIKYLFIQGANDDG